MEKLKLNDFDGFNKVLFGDHKPDWSKFYYKKSDTFIPPIRNPKTLVQFQLDHYALWMVMCAFKLAEKPNFNRDYFCPPLGCYACAACPNGIFDDCNDACPLCLKSYDTCGEDFTHWKNSRLPKYAYKVAHILWKERLK